MDSGELLDLVVGNGSPLSVGALIIWFVLKRSKVHQNERALDRKERAESQKAHAEERVSVQENFKEFLTPHSAAMAGTQVRVAEALERLAKELHTMSAQNTTEHGEILSRLRPPTAG